MKEALKLALEALEECRDRFFPLNQHEASRDLSWGLVHSAILAIKAALAQPAQEPVLWMMPDGKTADKWALQFYGGQVGKPLYTTPPQPAHLRDFFYTCNHCGAEKLVQSGNHHPWCACGSDNFDWGNGRPAQPEQEPTSGDYALGYAEGFNDACKKPAHEQWNAALDEAAARIGEIKGFGQATQDSFAVFIKGLKR